MKERPILFSAPMVRALLAGTKTQTRRVLGKRSARLDPAWPLSVSPEDEKLLALCPYGQPGDRLWVRESLGYDAEYGHYFAADRTFLCSLFDDQGKETGYSYDGLMADRSVPSIHLPRRYSRITLELTGVRVERLQDISEADAIAEGVHADPRCRQDDDTPGFHGIGPVRDASFPIARYGALWESLNGRGSWKANPWVWVLEFRRIGK